MTTVYVTRVSREMVKFVKVRIKIMTLIQAENCDQTELPMKTRVKGCLVAVF